MTRCSSKINRHVGRSPSLSKYPRIDLWSGDGGDSLDASERAYPDSDPLLTRGYARLLVASGEWQPCSDDEESEVDVLRGRLAEAEEREGNQLDLTMTERG
jgi:hypothetical protein